MTIFQAIFLAIVQGATELFPVSSLGHAVVLPRLLGWDVDQKSPEFLPFLVVLHLGTATALLAFFWKDWYGFIQAVLGYGQNVKNERHIFKLVIVATLPAVILGFLLEHLLRSFFGAPLLAAVFLMLNGFILYFGDRLKRSGQKNLSEINWKAALAIGACQALALIPGLSRSGTTMVGGVLSGLYHKDAARFSFLLATPIIFGAGVLEIPKILHQPHLSGMLTMNTIIVSGIVAAIVAWLSIFVLMRYFKKHEIEALSPFAYYCWSMGFVSCIILYLYR